MPLGTAFETLLSTNYNSFFLMVGIIDVGIYSIEGDSRARDMFGNCSHSEGTSVLLEISSMYTLDIFRVCTGMRIYMSLKV